MTGKRKYFMAIFTWIIAAMVLLPNVGYAVDFSITEVKIDAFLQDDGKVEVKESHTYSFDGEFNGITREIVPKEGTEITQFIATENGKSLRIERDETLYKIHRKGEDEAVTVNISYMIENGVDVYSDVAEFYWPFFDERNESSYGEMMIVIHPPKKTSEVIAFGYDEAFDTEEISSDGSVLFQLGEVPSGENGDIRVAYDATLFPNANIAADKPMKSEIIRAEQSLYDEAAEFADKQETFSKIAIIIVPIFTVLLLIMFISFLMRERMKKLDVHRQLQSAFFIPKEILSMPATIYFTKGMAFLPAEAMSAAVLDLVRKGIVTKTEDNRFSLRSMPTKLLEHEQLLIDFLFHEIGSGQEFSFEDLSSYTKRKKNHEKFQNYMMKWQQAIQKEVKEANLYEKNSGFRWTLFFFGLILSPLLFFFPSYDLFGWFFATLVIVVIFWVFAASYITKSWDGLMIVEEWKSLHERILQVSHLEWEALTNDEQMRTYIYGIGTKDEDIIEKNEQFVQSFRPSQHSGYNDWNAVNVNSMIFIGPHLSSNFHSAHKTTQSTTSSSSSSSSSSGGGVGGGGGGSGAF